MNENNANTLCFAVSGLCNLKPNVTLILKSTHSIFIKMFLFSSLALNDTTSNFNVKLNKKVTLSNWMNDRLRYDACNHAFFLERMSNWYWFYFEIKAIHQPNHYLEKMCTFSKHNGRNESLNRLNKWKNSIIFCISDKY